MVKIFRITFFAFALSFISISAQSISVTASTDTTDYQVGDYITLTLEVRYDSKLTVQFPPVKDSVKVLEYIQELPSEKKEVDGRVVDYRKFVFSKYDSAQVTIPSLYFSYSEGKNGEKKYIATVPITINVRTLQVNPQEEIRDVKEPLKLPLNWLLIILIILLVAGLAVGAYYLYKYWKKKRQGVASVEPEIIIPPHERALSKLSELEQKKLWQNGLVKEYHSEVTEIARQYFEDRFSFRALEMPSSEILGVLSYLPEGQKIVSVAANFFSNADLVKFAKFEPIPQVNEEMMRQAYEIVNQTIPLPPLPESEQVGDTDVQ
jgi:hypothetical protein